MIRKLIEVAVIRKSNMLQESGFDRSAEKHTKTHVRPKTWRFDFPLKMPAFSDPEVVRDACIQILDSANIKSEIKDLEQSSFSYDVPEEGCLANISGYLHGSAKINDTFVQKWIVDERISGEIEWTPILPGKHGDWKQQRPIEGISAACNDGGTRRLHDWVGSSSDGWSREGAPERRPLRQSEGTDVPVVPRRRRGCAAARPDRRPWPRTRPCKRPCGPDSTTC